MFFSQTIMWTYVSVFNSCYIFINVVSHFRSLPLEGLSVASGFQQAGGAEMRTVKPECPCRGGDFEA